MEKVLVTGGAGFIGSHLVKSLVKEEYRVVVLDNLLNGNKLDEDILNKVSFVNGDVRDCSLVEKLSKDCKVIFHLAAIIGVDKVAEKPMETMETEAISMKNIVDSSLKNSVEKVIYASTSGVYGHSAIEKSVSEDIILDPRTSYSIAKRFNEIYLKAAFEEKGLKSASLRFFNVYGPKQDDRMVIPRLFEQAMANNPLTIFGSGNQTRDFTFIDDTVKSMIELSKLDIGCEVFNVANESEISINDLAKIIIKAVNSKSEIHNLKNPQKRYDFEVERRVGNSSKLFDYIKYRPNTKIEEGLKIIYEGIKE